MQSRKLGPGLGSGFKQKDLLCTVSSPYSLHKVHKINVSLFQLKIRKMNTWFLGTCLVRIKAPLGHNDGLVLHIFLIVFLLCLTL